MDIETLALAKKYTDEHGGGGGTTYTAGDAIDLTNNEISVKHDPSLSVDDQNRLTVTNNIVYFDGSSKSGVFTLSNNKTIKDIVDAINNGKIVYLRKNDGAVLYSLFAASGLTETYAAITFTNVSGYPNGSSNVFSITCVLFSGNPTGSTTTGTIITKMLT